LNHYASAAIRVMIIVLVVVLDAHGYHPIQQSWHPSDSVRRLIQGALMSALLYAICALDSHQMSWGRSTHTQRRYIFIKTKHHNLEVMRGCACRDKREYLNACTRCDQSSQSYQAEVFLHFVGGLT
jgi:sterol desaturase/sphingolipid hydroxylase (fatty acid hydroxylase superfamily)